MKKIGLLFVLCGQFFILKAQQTDSISNIVKIKKEQIQKLKAQQKKLLDNLSKAEKELQDLTTPDKYWKYNSFTTLTLNQTQYSNWVAGGENSLAILATHDFDISYINTSSKISWLTKFNGLLGYKTKDDNFQKTNDILNLFSNISQEFQPKLSYALDLAVRTQFLSTKNYEENTSKYTSTFFAPAYTNLGLGFKWVPKAWFTLYLSPITSQFVFVFDDDINPVTFGLQKGTQVKSEVGWYANFEINKPIGKSVNFNLRSLFFDNYTNDKNNSGDIDVNSRLKIDFKIIKYFYASLFMNLKYDADEKINLKPAGIQVFENIGIGFSYKIGKML